MITEDYVSFEVAKLLQEKNFIGEFHKYYYGYEPGKEFLSNFSYNPEYDYPAPTLGVAMKWLRKVHNLHIEIIWYQLPLGYAPNIVNVKEHKTVASIRNKNKEWDEPEEAIEAAIKYCLENLI